MLVSKTATAIGAMLLGAGILMGPAQAQTVTLKLQTFIPPISNPPKTFLIPWAKKIEAASKGRLKIQGYWSMQLGGKAP